MDGPTSARCPDCGRILPTGVEKCPDCASELLTEPWQPAYPEIEGYRIVKPLGQGGMGTVYLAEDLALGRQVAAKLVSRSFGSSGGDQALRRFHHEARAMANVDHQHAVRVYALVKTGDGQEAILMEYVEGESLAQRLRREGRLEAEAALELLRQACEGLEAAAEVGIVHRDLKPANLLLDGKGRLKVADFGLAKALEADQERGVTSTGFAVGTPHYVSPEQAKGEAVDFRSDIYSLGIVLYEMLTGAPPFIEESPLEILFDHLHKDLPPLEAARPELAPAVAQLVSWMSRKDRGERPRSYRELVQRIDQVLDRPGQTLATTPMPALPQAPRSSWTRKRTLALAIAVTVLGILVGALWFAWPLLFDPVLSPRRYERSVAVLYFGTVGPEIRATRFADGLSDEVMSRLAKIRSLKVTPRIDVLRYRTIPATTAEIARDLGVDAIVEGTVEILGDELRVSAQLVDAEHRFVLWAETYRHELEEIFTVQEKITGDIVTAMNLELSRSEKREIRRPPTRDFSAYELLLEGEASLTRWTAGDIDRAIPLFQRAIEHDPAFADAHAYLAFAHVVRAYFGGGLSTARLEAIRDHSRRALALDPDNEVALIGSIGHSMLRIREGSRIGLFELRGLMLRLRTLVDRCPDSALGSLGVAHYYLWLKRDPERAKSFLRNALTRADVALEVEPDNRLTRGIAAEASGVLANILRSEGNLAGAIELTERSLQYFPSVARTYSQLSSLYQAVGESERAIAVLESGLEHAESSEQRSSMHLYIGANYYRRSRLEEALGAFRTSYSQSKVASDHPNDYSLLYWYTLSRRLEHASYSEAEEELRARAAALDNDGWPGPLINLFVGETTAGEVLEHARRDWQRCEAHYFIGLYALDRGDVSLARSNFEASLGTGVASYLEYDFSKVELEALASKAGG